MSGQTELLFYCIVLISLVAIVTDLLRGKIYNWLTLPSILLGLGVSTTLKGFSGLGDAFLAVGLALLLFGWMFFFGVMGAGDVKLLMALGAWGGTQYVAYVALLSILVGGVLGFIQLAIKGHLKGFIQKLTVFFVTLLGRDLRVEFPEANRKITMPFGLSIGIAAIWVWVQNPFLYWRVF